MFGKIENPKNETLPDLSGREFATFAPLIVLAVWIGLYPKPFLDRLETSVQRVVARVSPQYGQAASAAATPPPTPRAGGRRRAAQFLAAAPCGPDGQPLAPGAAAAEAALMPPGISLSDFYYILPEIVLTAGALLVLDRRRAAAARQPRAGVGDARRALARRALSLRAVRQHRRRGRATA